MLLNILFLFSRFEISMSTTHELVSQFMMAVIQTFRHTVALSPDSTSPTALPGLHIVGYIDGWYMVSLNSVYNSE